MRRTRMILLASMLAAILAAAGLRGEGKISGLMFGDYYYALSHHDAAIEGHNGFWLRRIYFTYDAAIGERMAMRLRLEANSPGDFKTSSTLVPFVKDAYLTRRLGRHTLMLGLIGTPLYDNLDEFWGYRPMEKTPVDLFKFGNSRELGLGVKGPLDAKGRLTYTLVAGNGAGLKSETNRGKAVYGRLNFQPKPSWFLELYADYTDTGAASSVSIFQAFAGLNGGWGRAGLNFGLRRAKADGAASDMKFISLFAVAKAGKRLELVGRFDRLLDPNPAGSKIDYIPMADHARANVVLAGLGWSLGDGVKLIPNIKYVFYDAAEGGAKPGSDFYAYITLYFKF